MKKIRLSKGKFCLVDDDNYVFLNKISWYYSGGYAVRKSALLNIQPMHRFILRNELKNNPNLEIDHKNGNPLDNRLENLRFCTHQQNSFNTKKRENTSSIYKGVHKKKCGTFQASIKCGNEYIYLGCYKDEKKAANAYNQAALKYFGEFARLNQID